MNKYKSVKEFNDWVDTIYKEFKKHSKLIQEDVVKLYNNSSDGISTTTSDGVYILTYIPDKGKLILINNYNGKSGYARWDESIPFNGKIALAVAYARYCKIEIPKVRKYLTQDNVYKIPLGSTICCLSSVFGTEHEFEFIAPDTKHNYRIIIRTDTGRIESAAIGENVYWVKEKDDE
jgi:hypothetical protein